MSIILKFPLERVHRKAHSHAKSEQSADILVFEGVQYQKNQPVSMDEKQGKVLTSSKKQKP